MSLEARRGILAARAASARTSPIDEAFRLIHERPDVVSFAAGAPDASLLSVALVTTLSERALRRFGAAALQYGLTQGFAPLRTAALPLLAGRGVACTAADVHVSTGGSGALNNLCMVLLDKGDIVLVERPTYSPAIKTMLAYEATPVAVECDDEGMVPAALERHLRGRAVKFVYLLPTFQNPTGRTMSYARRRQIADLLITHDVLAVEDDVYYDLRYRGEHLPALHAFAPTHVAYLTSVSKILAPAMRVGLAIVPAPLREKLHILKQGIDMQTSSYTQAIVTEFLEGDYQSHIDRIRQAYGRKLEILLKALEAHMPTGFSWTRPDGGMFLWVQGPAGFNADATLRPALDAGVAYLPGNSFFVHPGTGRNTMRLSFANPAQDRIEQGIERLARAVGAA